MQKVTAFFNFFKNFFSLLGITIISQSALLVKVAVMSRKMKEYERI